MEKRLLEILLLDSTKYNTFSSLFSAARSNAALLTFTQKIPQLNSKSNGVLVGLTHSLIIEILELYKPIIFAWSLKL